MYLMREENSKSFRFQESLKVAETDGGGERKKALPRSRISNQTFQSNEQ